MPFIYFQPILECFVHFIHIFQSFSFVSCLYWKFILMPPRVQFEVWFLFCWIVLIFVNAFFRVCLLIMLMVNCQWSLLVYILQGVWKTLFLLQEWNASFNLKVLICYTLITNSSEVSIMWSLWNTWLTLFATCVWLQDSQHTSTWQPNNLPENTKCWWHFVYFYEAKWWLLKH